MKDFKYKTSFSSSIKPLVSEEKDEYLALAALSSIGDFIPDIDTEKNIDILPIAFNAFVANRVNKNGDVINTEAAIEISNSFINKPINVEHNRTSIIGTILKAGYSEFGTDRPLTEDQVKDMKGPFNVTLGGVVWRMVNPELSDLIERSSDPTSEDYLSVSASWELGFSEYNLVALQPGEKNIENGDFITNIDEIEALEANLTSLGGDGVLENGKFVYRHVVGEIIPLGIGLTESPAADVQGVASKRSEELKAAEVISTPENDTEKTISQNSVKNVKNTNNTEEKVMKINNIKDITDSNLEKLSASAISDFIEEELKDASEKFAAEKRQVQDSLDESKEAHEALSKENQEMKQSLEGVQAELNTLLEEKDSREKQESFNVRMSKMDEAYELNDEDREVIASDIKDMNDEDFEAYEKKMAVLLSAKNREQIKASAEKAEAEQQSAEKEAKKEEVEEVKAEETTEEIVEEVLKDEETKTEVPVSTTASEPTVYDRYKNAFELDGFDIK